MNRRSLAALAAGLVTCVLTVVPLGPAAGARPAAPRGADQPRLTLLGQPVAVEPDGTFTVFVAAEHAPTATSLAVDVYDRVEPGDAVGVQPTGGSDATFPVVPLGSPKTASARNAAFTIHLFTKGHANPDPAWGYRINEPGVYPVRIALWDTDGNVLSTLITSIIRLPGPGQTVSQTDAALLVPVHQPPPDDAAQRAANNRTDDTLFDDLDPVLDDLAAHPSLPATYSITPDTVARVAADSSAATDLARLRTALARDDQALLDAPYVHIDAASLVDNDLADTLDLQHELGQQTLSELLEPPTAGTWQLQDRVDTATLRALDDRGISRTLLPADALVGGGGVQAPVDLSVGDHDVRAVAVSGAYALGLQAPEDPVLAAHRLLARLAATGPSATGAAGVVVSIDPATVTPASLQIVTDALSFGTPFFAATGVDDLFAAKPAPPGATLTDPPSVHLGTYPVDLQRSQSALTSYLSMVGGATEQIRPYERTLAISAADDLALDQRELDARSVSAALQVPFNAISIPAKDKVTLGAQDATFPLPIESGLDYPVKVVIELDANDRVEFPRNRIETDLPPGRTVLNIRVKTHTAGDTPVRVSVRTPDDGVVLAESKYTIRATAVSGVGVFLTVGAVVFLALWWGRHWYRNRGKARHARGPGPGSPGPPPPGPDDEPILGPTADPAEV